MSIKLTIPDEATLRTRVAAIAGSVMQTLTEESATEVSAYTAALKKRRQAWGWSLGLIGMIVVLNVWTHPLALFGFILSLSLTVRAWWRYASVHSAVARFEQVVTNAAVAAVAKLFALEDSFAHTTVAANPATSFWSRLLVFFGGSQNAQKEKIEEHLKASELITEPYNRFFVDDSWQVQFLGTTLTMSELLVQQVTQQGKHQHTKEIIHGYFISYTLPVTLEGKTFISTEGDTKGFGHQSFWSSRQAGAVSATSLEWNEFENLLHVATNNPTEARYILTPDVMQDVYDWWLERRGNIRISFIGKQMHILFPDSKMRLNTAVSKLTEEALAEYLFILARPMLHSLHLAEDMRKRFR